MAEPETDGPGGDKAKYAFRFDRDINEETGETVEIAEANSPPAPATDTTPRQAEPEPERTVSVAVKPSLAAVAPAEKRPLPPAAEEEARPPAPTPTSDPTGDERPKREWKPISAPEPSRTVRRTEAVEREDDADDADEEQDTLAGLIAGRKLETPEAERTFLLTLSRDQRLRYADLVQANERLDFDRERLAADEEQVAVERERIDAADRARRETHAAEFGRSVLRIVVGLNGSGCLVLVLLWAALGALGTSPDTGNFRLALWSFAGGTLSGALSAACAYARHGFLGSMARDGRPSSLAGSFRILAGLLAGGGMGLFVIAIVLVGSGLPMR